MGRRSRKYINSFLAFVIWGILFSTIPVLAQQSDLCGNTTKEILQENATWVIFPEPLRKKITKSFAKKLKQAKSRTEHTTAVIAFCLSDDGDKGLEHNVELYSAQYILSPKVKQALTQAIQENIKAGRDGVQRGVLYRASFEYSKPHPWKTAITIISLPVLIPLYAICIWGL